MSAKPKRSVPNAGKPAQPAQKARRKKAKKAEKTRVLSRLQKPAHLSLEEWQRELRRQFGREQNFQLRNIGDQKFFSEFEVTNPESRNKYRVEIRGTQPGENRCTCPDFTTNTLGTCKHIEFTLATLERKRGGKKALKAGFQPPESEVYLHYGARREVRFRPGAECPKQLARLAARFFGEDGALLPEGFATFPNFVEDAAKLEPDLHCRDDALAFIAEVRDADRRRRLVDEAFPDGIESPLFKGLVKAPLYDYQKEGVLFAARAGRCLLGDEMGLGKTLQGITTAEVMARLFGVERVLIVCPVSLKHQWEREIQRFSDHTVSVIYGERPRRERRWPKESFFKITNYDTVHADLDLIAHWRPDLVILDEAQRIKNWTTRTARSVKRIASPYAMVLTGTPLENRLEELISIVQFVDQHRLGPTFRLLHEHQIRDEVGKVVGYRDLDRLGRTLEPILVRRKKDEVLEQLPERIDSNIFVSMTDRQVAHHQDNAEIVATIVEKWRRLRFLSEVDKQRLMIAMQRMRMACDNSYLVDHTHDSGPKADEVVTLLSEILEDPGVKVVIFSQWLRMHEVLVRRLRGCGWGHVLFHGGVPGNKRKQLVDKFRDDPKCRLFLATDAGSTGLNLQHASVVINLDLPWNPAVLEQRIGRVHRLGQGRPVRVVNFVAQGTIEDGMLSVLKFKKSLFAGVLDDGEKEVFLGGTRLNHFMEQVEAATEAIPEEIVEDAEESLPREAEKETPSTKPTNGRAQPGAMPAIPTPIPLGLEEETPHPTPTANGTVEANPWDALIQAGMALFQQFAAAQNGTANPPDATPSANVPAPRVMRDEQTGETYLKVPVPSPEVVEQALRVVGALLEGFRR
jgi:superfamily II DNA or RNA helicase